jgi:ribosome-binding protein aMBF1 (putative translation factor)
VKTNHLPLKKALQKRLKDSELRFCFNESRAVSELCEVIAQTRQALGLNQPDLAKKIKTSQSVIARLENGNQGRMPSVDLLGRIAAALNLNLGFEKKKVA